MSEDGELLARILVDDDRQAFEILLKKYQAPIRSFFRKMCGGDAELADDLSQETFLKAYRGLSSFQGQSQLLTWFYAIARNVFYEHLRRREQFEELAPGHEPEVSMTRDLHMDIAKCMLHLDPEDRMVLTLSYAEGLSQTEVAAVLGIPLGTVKTRALRAKEQLKVLLQGYTERAL